ncbi:YrhK-like protein [Thioclava sp. ES.031]|uniref:YrhK family protein n=1 Tax=Thioclava sp. ES.031 TaxID=1798203 RepID=UPI000BF6AAD2|nr:YrhK family protein [Thioclava sp. ES.031]PFG64652.1 YrhK-like protein [Thioclava sp. ES.031]
MAKSNFIFDTPSHEQTPEQRRFVALTEIAYTVVDFGAAFCFVIGSIFFFYESLMIPGTWLFLIGSLLFAAKPSIRLWRELKLLEMGDYKDLAQRKQS